MDDWGAGSYEDTAVELEPAADEAVEALALEPGERVLDVACGTGNAALAAAGRGARVAGIDASERLVGVARRRVPDGEFAVGDAAGMPYEDGAFDAAVSVFGVVFARPAERAAAELARVVRPGGRLALTAWLPRGPAFEVIVRMREALARLRPPEGPPPTNWSDREVLERLLGRFGELEVSERELVPADARAEDAWARWERGHPMWLAARAQLEPAGEWEALRADAIAILREARAAGRIASPYVLAVLRRR